MTKPSPHKTPPHRSTDAASLEGGDQLAWLSHAALVLALALVASRALMLETLRDPFEPTPQSESVPGGPGAGTSVVLDLLCCVPALLVLTRRAFGADAGTRMTFGPALFLMIAGWACTSALWASDRFAAAIGAAHLVAAAALAWAGAQVVRDSLRLRLVAGICFGLLLAYVARGMIYRYVELPDLQRSFEEKKSEFLSQRGWEPGSFMAEQFSKKIVNGEMVGFSASPNTYAAVIVLLTFVTIGAFIQRIADRDERGWAIGLALPLPVAVMILYFTHSRTATAGLVLGLMGIFVLWWLRGTIAKKPRVVYGACVAIFVIGAIALVSHGIYHGGLFPGRFSDSLNFRWRYWVSAYQLALQHPLLGVGWNNFGDAYLAVRQLSAPEEIKDPHNFLVRALSELGVIGALLFIAWLIRTGWELARPRIDADAATRTEDFDFKTPSNGSLPAAITTIASIACLTLFITLFTSLDWTQDPNFLFVEASELALYASLLLGGAVIVTLRSSAQQILDTRLAPWLLSTMGVAIGVFLLHSLVDVALFEVGALLLVALLIGAVIGVRAPRRDVPPSGGRIAFGIGAAVFVAAGFLFVIPVAEAQRLAHQGENALRESRFPAAADLSQRAFDHVPYNADYAYHASTAMAWAREPADRVRAMIDKAITTNPMAAKYRLWKARYELRVASSADPARARDGFERALVLNPNDVPTRLEFADALVDRLEQPDEALRQYREALRYNDALDRNEGKRLHADELQRVSERIAQLQGRVVAE